MTNQEIFATAMRQSAIDLGCQPGDFERKEPVIVTAGISPDARKYLTQPYAAYFVSYGSNIVASVSPDLRKIVQEYLKQYPLVHTFEPPHLHILHEALKPLGFGVGITAEY